MILEVCMVKDFVSEKHILQKLMQPRIWKVVWWTFLKSHVASLIYYVFIEPLVIFHLVYSFSSSAVVDIFALGLYRVKRNLFNYFQFVPFDGFFLIGHNFNFHICQNVVPFNWKRVCVKVINRLYAFQIVSIITK